MQNEHRIEAERLASVYNTSHDLIADSARKGESAAVMGVLVQQQQAALLAAQVHATLALVDALDSINRNAKAVAR